jgi:hypothetical protein
MAPKVKPAKNSKLPELPENYFEPVEKGGWPPISTWIIATQDCLKDKWGNKLNKIELATTTKAQGRGLAYRFCAKVGEKK